VARSRKQAWLRDELVLALDLYMRAGAQAGIAEQQEISDILRAIPIEQHLATDPTFKSRQAVAYKLHNFVHLDPSLPAEGFPHGGAGDRSVWDEFADDPARLSATAAAIRANLSAVSLAEADAEEEDVADALCRGTVIAHPWWSTGASHGEGAEVQPL
jgi:hypothetical protein